MHIKLLTIEGFKTYKQATIIEPFSPHHNVILGRNGHGKSNIFDAIQFVLSDKFANLRTEERQGLLYEGSGRDVMTASVEIVFDNSDMRFPIEKDDVALKRTIGLKKDEYFLDNKHVTKSEVVSLLESAGLSRSNPYYIVQQGQVQRLIKMKNAERLELLKEIAGTRTYDDRRKESLKIMSDTDKRREQIEEVVQYIEKRLSELEEEKQELKQFQAYDSERRCLEYTIYDKEYKEALSKLEDIENTRENSSEKTNELHTDAADATKKREEAELLLKSLSAEITAHTAQKNGLAEELKRAMQARAQAELAVKEAQAELDTGNASTADASKEMKSLSSEIKSKEAKLATITKEFEAKAAEEEVLKDRVSAAEQRLSELYSKQGRADQFKTKSERDKYLADQIKDLEKDIAKEGANLAKMEKLMTTAAKDMNAKEKDLKAKTAEMDKVKKSVYSTDAAYAKLKADRNDATNARKELWREESDLKTKVDDNSAKLQNAEKQLQYTMDKMMYKGLETVKSIVAEKKIQGVYGPLIDLFEVDSKFQKCVETTAGNSLFSVVVDTDKTASDIIKELNSKPNSGRVTFMPLNQLSDRTVTYPKSQEIIPMINKVQFDNKYLKAMLQVFGKTLITRDLNVASQFARNHNFNTITLSGDQVNKKGALTGGYIDNKRSRLEIMSEIKRLKSEFQEVNSLADDIKQRIKVQETKVEKAHAEIEKYNENRTHLRNTFQQHQLDVKSLAKLLELEKNTSDRNAKVVKTLEVEIARLESKISALKNEMGQPFSSQLSKADQKELHDTNAELTSLREELISVSTERSAIETKRTTIQDLLSSNLRKRRDELETVISSQAADIAGDRLERETVVLQGASETAEALSAKVKALTSSISTATTNKTKTAASLDKLKADEAKAVDKLSKESTSFERLLNKRSLYLQKKEDCVKKIRDLGSLPSVAYDSKYKKMKQADLMKKLETVTNKLKAYTHVNKKAIDQFVSFTEQREDLMERKKELDKGRTAIMELIDHLDTKKHEAIDRTFKGIAKHFSTVFSELVPNGKGQLVINTKKKGEGDDSDDSSDEEDDDNKSADNSTRQYSGVGIKVSFTGSKGTDFGMQLSGGQQSIVALSLIFAIQRCDPSPFYLFDEIDSNLDAVHRTSVTRMIKEQAKTTQFITTTFRPEMIATANKFYGVTFVNNTSQTSVLDREEAKQLILVVEKENDQAQR
mmetsp:Transcript_10832/g.20577  ORF Transcript_10832/g.20577 Transcript_10832/m.20577 type:complete len:1210 (+) Transcript_10832:29-3658(+)